MASPGTLTALQRARAYLQSKGKALSRRFPIKDDVEVSKEVPSTGSGEHPSAPDAPQTAGAGVAATHAAHEAGEAPLPAEECHSEDCSGIEEAEAEKAQEVPVFASSGRLKVPARPESLLPKVAAPSTPSTSGRRTPTRPDGSVAAPHSPASFHVPASTAKVHYAVSPTSCPHYSVVDAPSSRDAEQVGRLQAAVSPQPAPEAWTNAPQPDLHHNSYSSQAWQPPSAAQAAESPAEVSQAADAFLARLAATHFKQAQPTRARIVQIPAASADAQLPSEERRPPSPHSSHSSSLDASSVALQSRVGADLAASLRAAVPSVVASPTFQASDASDGLQATAPSTPPATASAGTEAVGVAGFDTQQQTGPPPPLPAATHDESASQGTQEPSQQADCGAELERPLTPPRCSTPVSDDASVVIEVSGTRLAGMAGSALDPHTPSPALGGLSPAAMAAQVAAALAAAAAPHTPPPPQKVPGSLPRRSPGGDRDMFIASEHTSDTGSCPTNSPPASHEKPSPAPGDVTLPLHPREAQAAAAHAARLARTRVSPHRSDRALRFECQAKRPGAVASPRGGSPRRGAAQGSSPSAVLRHIVSMVATTEGRHVPQGDLLPPPATVGQGSLLRSRLSNQPHKASSPPSLLSTVESPTLQPGAFSPSSRHGYVTAVAAARAAAASGAGLHRKAPAARTPVPPHLPTPVSSFSPAVARRTGAPVHPAHMSQTTWHRHAAARRGVQGTLDKSGAQTRRPVMVPATQGGDPDGRDVSLSSDHAVDMWGYPARSACEGGGDATATAALLDIPTPAGDAPSSAAGTGVGAGVNVFRRSYYSAYARRRVLAAAADAQAAQQAARRRQQAQPQDTSGPLALGMSRHLAEEAARRTSQAGRGAEEEEGPLPGGGDCSDWDLPSLADSSRYGWDDGGSYSLSEGDGAPGSTWSPVPPVGTPEHAAFVRMLEQVLAAEEQSIHSPSQRG